MMSRPLQATEVVSYGSYAGVLISVNTKTEEGLCYLPSEQRVYKDDLCSFQRPEEILLPLQQALAKLQQQYDQIQPLTKLRLEVDLLDLPPGEIAFSSNAQRALKSRDTWEWSGHEHLGTIRWSGFFCVLLAWVPQQRRYFFVRRYKDQVIGGTAAGHLQDAYHPFQQYRQAIAFHRRQFAEAETQRYRTEEELRRDPRVRFQRC